MKIGVFYENLMTGIYKDKDYKEVLPIAVQSGIEFLEMNWYTLAELGDEFVTFVHSLGMALTAYLCTDENGITSFGTDAEAELPRMQAYGLDKFLMVYAQDYPANADKSIAKTKIIKSLNPLIQSAKRYGIKVNFEDFDGERIPCGSCADLLAYSKESPELLYTFDTGNFYFFGENAIDAYPLMKDRIVHVHLKDYPSLTNLTECVPGKGCLPLAEILHTLYADGYNGWISIEMFGTPMSYDALGFAVNFIKDNFR